MFRAHRDIKEAITEISGVEFTKACPDWLRDSITGRRMEIDFYNDDLKVGINYYGPHHYHFNRNFCRSDQEFQDLQRRDKEKKKLCKQNGVLLIIITCDKSDNQLKRHIRNAINFSPLRTLSLRTIRLKKIQFNIPKALLNDF